MERDCEDDGLGLGLNYYVSSLAVSGTDLYVGGQFNRAGGSSANGVAKWNGSVWSNLGSGVNLESGVSGYAFAMALFGGDLYVGGDFTTAGGKVSVFIAKANIVADPTLGRFSNMVYSPVTGFRCTFLDASVGQPYRIQTSPALAAGSWIDFTNFIYTGPIVITDTSATSSTNKFFSAVSP